MKKILVILMVLFISCRGDEKKYCGEIIQKGYEGPTSGYKSSRDANYFVILKVDSINTGIRVDVTVPTFYGLKEGDRTCFTLTEGSLGSYGNGYKHLIK
jgi:hypothetical protein